MMTARSSVNWRGGFDGLQSLFDDMRVAHIVFPDAQPQFERRSVRFHHRWGLLMAFQPSDGA